MSDLLDKPLLCTADFARVLGTNPSFIRRSRSTGLLYGLPAPKWRRMGRKVMYEREEIIAWLKLWKNSSPELRVTDAPEPDGLREAREG